MTKDYVIELTYAPQIMAFLAKFTIKLVHVQIMIGSLLKLEASLEEAMAKGAKGAPVHLWSPSYCGELDLKIDGNGAWHYGGTPIARPALVKLFATVLKREGERFFLVTPHEKLGINVEDAPFLAVDMKVVGEGEAQLLRLATNVGQGLEVGADHPLRFSHDDGFKAYVEVRNGLEALFSRALTHQLVELIVEHDGQSGLWSGGVFFPIPDDTEAKAP